MLPALFNTVLVHHSHMLTRPASLVGLGMGVVTLVGTLVMFWRLVATERRGGAPARKPGGARSEVETCAAQRHARPGATCLTKS
jgi:hypothetical protein